MNQARQRAQMWLVLEAKSRHTMRENRLQSGDVETSTVCLFSASAEKLDSAYVEAAQGLGRLFGEAGWNLVFGGGAQGLMGHAARALHDAGGHVTGVIPAKLDRPGVTYTASDELIVTDTLRERKHEMDRRADAFVALPGGFGTLEEIIEVLALKQLGYHNRPIIFLNTRGFYNRLTAFFEHQVAQGFVRGRYMSLFAVEDEPEGVVDYVLNYAPTEVADKYAQD